MSSLNNAWLESVADNFSCQTREKNDKESKTKKEKEKGKTVKKAKSV